ncbi:WD40-repeat-containing domain protein [Lentinula raphanica]|nr:WD40-repeat-containing domain protein [Lentinula raphanica]
MGSTISYQQTATLRGHADAILSLCYSFDGKFIAATGYAGVHVWEVSTSALVRMPVFPFASRDPKYAFSASCWLFFEKDQQHILLLGSMCGDVLVWGCKDRQLEFLPIARAPTANMNKQISSLEVREMNVPNGRNGRIIFATIDGRVNVWSLSNSGEFSQIFSISLAANVVPRAVLFSRKNVLVFAMTGGTIIQLNSSSGDVLSQRNYGPDVMGSVCLDPDTDSFVAWTGNDFNLFNLNDLTHVRTFEGKPPTVLFPKRAVFTEHGNKLACGTDRGYALLYDRATGKRAQTLDYPRGGLVQQVTAYTTDKHYLLAIAGSASQQPCDVILYRKARKWNYRATPKVDPAPTTNTSPDQIWIGFHLSRTTFWFILYHFRNCLIIGFLFFELIRFTRVAQGSVIIQHVIQQYPLPEWLFSREVTSEPVLSDSTNFILL